MRILLINSVCGTGSTGRICTDLAKQFEAEGHEVKIAYGRQAAPKQFEKYAVRIGNDLDVKLHGLRTRLLDEHGFGSGKATKAFLRWADAYNPDLVWLHNLHGYYINIELLFAWIKSRPNMQVKWTLHDCWAFTGHCAHYIAAGCNKWGQGCEKCVLKHDYPTSIWADQSKRNYERKKELFTGVPSMDLIVPSRWLAEQVGRSFLSAYPVHIIPNGIDLDAFKPEDSDFREKHGLEDKIVVLGAATTWSDHKGFGRFAQLAELLDEKYQIVLVGVSQKQLKSLPTKILGLPRTNSVKELAQYYTAADVCVSLSVAETMGLTMVEANACGTPVIAFNRTALPELITPKTGIVVDNCDVATVAKVLKSTDFAADFLESDCISHAKMYSKQRAYSFCNQLCKMP